MSGEKTEAPTDKRLRDARARGEVPRSRELVATVACLVACVTTIALLPPLVHAYAVWLRASLSLTALGAEPAALAGAGRAALLATLALLTPPTLAAVVVAYVDAGPVFAPKRLAPDLSVLDPVKGLGQLVHRDRLVDLLRAVLGLGIVSAVAALVLRDHAPALARLPARGPEAALRVLGAAGLALARGVAPWLAGFAALDLVLTRLRFTRDRRMTKDEVRREHKESEGDPHLRGERARLHREVLEHSVLEGVRRASVLVVNPTHVAVALRWDEDGDAEAPDVLAKGEDHLARAMIAAAHEAGVPVVRDVPLARTLHQLEVGDCVPEALYEAVAAVLRAAAHERGEA